jgi:hypothetical protein
MALGKQLQAAAQHNLHLSASDSPAASFLIVMTAVAGLERLQHKWILRRENDLSHCPQW